MKCAAHLLGLEWECRDPDCDDIEESEDGPSERNLSDPVLGGSDLGPDEAEEEEERRTYKDPSAYKDQQSTGRKQAARWYPLNPEELCEWAGKINCGGGRYPITGCAANLQQARHHGPDKSTLNNDKGNVHRICHTCHNRWHTMNDAEYVRDQWALTKHEPQAGTAEDIVAAEDFWKNRRVVTAKD